MKFQIEIFLEAFIIEKNNSLDKKILPHYLATSQSVCMLEQSKKKKNLESSIIKSFRGDTAPGKNRGGIRRTPLKYYPHSSVRKGMPIDVLRIDAIHRAVGGKLSFCRQIVAWQRQSRMLFLFLCFNKFIASSPSYFLGHGGTYIAATQRLLALSTVIKDIQEEEQ